MRKVLLSALVVLGAIAMTASLASAGNGTGANSHQWMRDDDGDGIPNGMDTDWLPPADGSGYGRLGPFIGPVPGFPGSMGNQATTRSEYRWRSGTATGYATGDYLRIRLRLRDPSCR